MLSVYSFVHVYLSISLHCILLLSIFVIYYAGFWFSMLGGDVTIEVKGPVPGTECTRTLGIEWGHDGYRTWSD